MADFQSGRRSLYMSSDQMFERNCGLCEKEQKTMEAVDYCKMCCEFLCSSCLVVHNKLPALSDHRRELVGRSAMLKIPEGNTARDTLTMMCEDHGRVIDLYCHSHETVCCSVCQAEKHVLCKDKVIYIPNITRFPNKQEWEKAMDDLRHANKQLRDMQTACKSEQTRILEDRINILEQIAAARRRLNQILDIMEQDTIQEAETRLAGCDVIIRASLQECNDVIKTIQQTTKQLEEIDKRKEAQMFVLIKKGREQIKRCWEIQRSRNEGQVAQVKFTASRGLEKTLIENRILGKFRESEHRSQQLKTGSRRLPRTPIFEEEKRMGFQTVWPDENNFQDFWSRPGDAPIRTTGEEYTIVTRPEDSDESEPVDDSDDNGDAESNTAQASDRSTDDEHIPSTWSPSKPAAITRPPHDEHIPSTWSPSKPAAITRPPHDEHIPSTWPPSKPAAITRRPPPPPPATPAQPTTKQKLKRLFKRGKKPPPAPPAPVRQEPCRRTDGSGDWAAVRKQGVIPRDVYRHGSSDSSHSINSHSDSDNDTPPYRQIYF